MYHIHVKFFSVLWYFIPQYNVIFGHQWQYSMIFKAHLEYLINTMVFISVISHGLIIRVYIMACDAGRTTVLLIVMECKLNAVLAFASEKKRQTNKPVIHRKSLSVSSLKRARLIINMFRLPSRFPAFWPFRLNSSPSFGFCGVMDVCVSVGVSAGSARSGSSFSAPCWALRD